LPEWSGSLENISGWSPTTISECSVKAGYVDISIPSSITEGTWIFRYKFKYPTEAGGSGGVCFFPIYAPGIQLYTWDKDWEAHHHCIIESWLHGEPTLFSMDYDGAATYEDGEWHKVVLIRKGNYFYAFKEIKHQSLPESKMMFEFHAYEPLDNTSEIKIYMRDMGSGNPNYIDSIQVYEGKYLFPYDGNIYIGNYFYDHWDNGEGLAPLWKEGIIVQGRNNTLKDIASAINNPSIFSYDEETKTAICYKDLVLDEGAELIIKDETLKFHSTYDGELSFVLDYGSRLHVENSTITSNTEHYWVWNNAGSTTHWSNELVMYMDLRKTEPSYGTLGWSGHLPLDVAYHGEFIIRNSTIDNFAHLFLDSPYEVNITDSKFTDIHEVDIGLYNPLGGAWPVPRDFCKGNKSIWIYTDDVNINDWTIKNVTISGAEHPLNFTFLLNAHRDKYNIYNINAEDDYIIIKESMAENSGQSHSCYYGSSSGPWGNIYRHNSYIASELGLVNCKFKDILITPGIFTDMDGRKKQKAAYVKYYLDVKAVDKDGNPVEYANVSVNVEQDWDLDDMKTNHHPVENMVVEKPYAVGNYTCFYHHYRWVDGQPLNQTYTTATGHTPLPSDANNTLVIADYKKCLNLTTNETEMVNFTYTIMVNKTTNQGNVILKNTTNTIYPNGTVYYTENKTFTGNVTGVDPNESWYRANPLNPTYTVNITITTGDEVNMSVNSSAIMNLTMNEYSSDLVNFTATNTTTDQKMNITVFNGTFKITNGKKYEIKKDGVAQQTKTASNNKVVFTDIPVGSDYVITEESGDNSYTVTLAQGYNMLAWTSTTPTNSSNLCNEVPNCTYVYKKNPDGSWTTKQCGYPGGEFTVSRGFGFLAYVTEACEWTRDE